MEGVPKDVLNYKICDYLSLRDIFALACTSKYFLRATESLLRRVREMYAKWFPKRCYLEAVREKNTKIMEYFQQYRKYEFDYVSSPKEILVDYLLQNDGEALDIPIKEERSEEEICLLIINCIDTGNWEYFDKLAEKYPAALLRCTNPGFILGSEPSVTIFDKKDLLRFIGNMCKRKLYTLENFMKIVARKCLEIDDYAIFSQLKFDLNDFAEYIGFVIFCDDPRFVSLFPVLTPTIFIPEWYDPNKPVFGNRELQRLFVEHINTHSYHHRDDIFTPQELNGFNNIVEEPQSNDGCSIL